ncbi:MAG: MFS transporter [Rhodomicrobium sp.]|nr:MFS transporter [Rhodomicrobium sp.]
MSAPHFSFSSTVLALGTTQTLAWASSYYLLAILADPIAKDTGMSTNAVFAAFSGALLIAALLGPRAGRTIDRFGGRAILMASNVFFAAGLGLMAMAMSWPAIWAAWLLMGIGMGIGLYDAAFATLGRIYGMAARGSITGITLMAGFASTVGWPLTAMGLSELGWRETCLAWAIAHLLIGIPLNAALPKTEECHAGHAAEVKPRLVMDRNMWLLAFAFAAGWTISTAMAAQLPRLLTACGSTEAQAIAAGTLIGPAQVAARMVEAGLMKRFHPLLSARLSAVLHPLGAAFLLSGAAAVPVFTLLHGAGNGILTIARGTVPLAIYGPENYGYRLGILGAPARIAQAAAPLLFGLLIENLGARALMISAGLSLATLAAFMLVQPGRVLGDFQR